MAVVMPDADTTSDGSRGDTPKQSDHAVALGFFTEAWAADRQTRSDMTDDGGFYIGGDNQWDGAALTKRRNAQRPALTLNKLPQFVRQVTGEVRKNPPSIKFMPAGGEATQEVAEILTGLSRQIQAASNAKSAYVTATEGAVIVGQGAWRVVTEYSADDKFEQDIRIKRIPDHLSFIDDPFTKEADRRDRRYFFVFTEMPRKEYERQYPDAPVSDMPDDVRRLPEGWGTKDVVRVAEYWCRVPIKRKLLAFSDGRVMFEDDFAKGVKSGRIIPDPNITIEAERDVDTWRVESRLMNGAQWLTEPQPWAGKYIPFAVVIGEEIVIGGSVSRKGVVRDAKDPQRIVNYMRTSSVEAAAMQPKAPWLVTVDQIAGLETFWQNSGVENYAYLPWKPDPQAPGAPQRAQPALAQAGLDIQAQIASQDMKEVIGIYDPQLGQKSNETSGRAILARQEQGDTGTFHFIDNLATAIMFTGLILIDLIPKIYDTQRVVRVLAEDGKAQAVEINKPMMEAGINKVLNDMTVGEYDVVVAAGPSFSTKRAEAVESMTEFVRSVPQAGALLGDKIAENMDWPGAEGIAKRLQMLLPPEIRQMEGIQGPPPSPPPEALAAQQQAEQQQAELQFKQTEAAAKAQMEMAKLEADMEIKRAELAIETERLALEREKIALEREKLALQAVTAERTAAMAEREAAEPEEPDEPAGDPEMRQHAADIADFAQSRTAGEVGGLIGQMAPALEALGQGQAQLGESMQAGLERLAQATEQLAAATMAETELVRDPVTNKPLGARKKPPAMVM